MKAPSINIVFKEKAQSIITRGERGICGLILQDLVLQGTSFDVLDVLDIPSTLSEENVSLIKSALLGNNTAPKKIIVYIMTGNDETAYNKALEFIENSKIDIVAFSRAQTDNMCELIANSIVAIRERNKKIKCVLPSYQKDNEAIVNWDGVVYQSGVEVNKEEYAIRIAGAIAGTSMKSSITYMNLSDVDNCERLSKDEIDQKVEQGKLISMWDGEKVKIVNDVTSFITTTADKGDSFKVIKLVRDMDLIYTDLYTTIRDEYIGKYANGYDDQCVLLTSINDYLSICVSDGLIASGRVEFDILKKRQWVKEAIAIYPDKFDKPYEDMTDEDIKRCWSSDKVFFSGRLSLLDTMKEVDLEFLL